MTSREESILYSEDPARGNRIGDRGTSGLVTMQIIWAQDWGTCVQGVNLALDYEPVLEALFSVGKPAKELKNTKTPTGYLDWEVLVIRITSH